MGTKSYGLPMPHVSYLFYFNSKKLDDQKRIADYNIRNNEPLLLVPGTPLKIIEKGKEVLLFVHAPDQHKKFFTGRTNSPVKVSKIRSHKSAKSRKKQSAMFGSLNKGFFSNTKNKKKKKAVATKKSKSSNKENNFQKKHTPKKIKDIMAELTQSPCRSGTKNARNGLHGNIGGGVFK